MAKDTMVITRKLKLYPVGDKEEVERVYTFIRDGQYAQYLGLNLLMGQLASKFYACNRQLNDEEFVEFRKQILNNSNPLLEDIEFPKGVDTKSAITRKVSQDFSTAIKNGLARGERSVNNYKRTIPLITRSRSLKFYHEYPTYSDFLDNLKSSKLEVFLSWVNGIEFKVILGNPKRSNELRCVIQNIFEEVYEVQGSSIGIENNKIILNLSIKIPKKEVVLDENVVVGVNLGIHTPVTCALNIGEKLYRNIGNAQDFMSTRKKIQSQRRSLQSRLKYNKGGHGRKRKLAPLERYNSYERNFAKTYNHMLSKEIVDFAEKNRAKYIHILDLSYLQEIAAEGRENHKDTTQQIILKNWAYYQLNEYISYKAELKGIQVKVINPQHLGEAFEGAATDIDKAKLIASCADFKQKRQK